MEEENEGHSRKKRSVDLNLSEDEQNAIDESDVIMTFESISKSYQEFLNNLQIKPLKILKKF